MKKEQLHTNKGFSVVELLVALSIFLVFTTAFFGVSNNANQALKRSVNNERAVFLADEAIESVINIRDENFSNLSNGTFGLVASSSGFGWVLDSQPDQNDIFTRTINITDGNSQNEKIVNVSVNWDDQISNSNQYSVSTILTDWRSFVPEVGITLKKNIINYYEPISSLSNFSPFELIPFGTTTVLHTFDTNTVIEDPIGTFTFETFDTTPGEYTISENLSGDYNQTFSPECENGNINLLAGQPVVCTITNEQKYASLTVRKVVDNVFGGNKSFSDFEPFKYDTNNIAHNTKTKIKPGTYTIGETLVSNYSRSYSGDCNVNGVITLQEGDDKICTIINTQNSSGGSGPTNTWVNPNTIDSILDLSGTADGRKIFVLGNHAYVVRASTTNNFSIINISNTALPVLTSTITLPGNPTNVFVSGNYAFVSSDSDSEELQVVDISNKTLPQKVASFNADGSGNANGLGITGSNLFLTRQNVGGFPDFLVFNISNPLTPVLSGQLNTGATSYEVTISGIYAYVASGDNIKELQIVNISNPALPTVVGTLDLTTNTDAITIDYLNDIVLIGQGTNLFKVNVANRNTPVLNGSRAIGGTVNDISIANLNNYAFIASTNSTAELTVLNYSPSNPTVVGVFNGSASYTGVAYDSSFDRAFMTSIDNVGEFQIIKP